MHVALRDQKAETAPKIWRYRDCIFTVATNVLRKKAPYEAAKVSTVKYLRYLYSAYLIS